MYSFPTIASLETNPTPDVLIELAFQQLAVIVNNQGDFNWRHLPLLYGILQDNALELGARSIKNDPEILELVHRLLVAHETFNNPAIAGDSSEQLIRTYQALAHDRIEGQRDKNLACGLAIDDASVYDMMLDDWPGYGFVERVRPCILYMTDAANAPKERRMEAQYAKSFDAYGLCIIPTDQQELRFTDKYSQLFLDVWLRKNGKLSDDRTTRALRKAKERLWVCDLPAVAQARKVKYMANVKFLETEVAQIEAKRQPAISEQFAHAGLATTVPAPVTITRDEINGPSPDAFIAGRDALILIC